MAKFTLIRLIDESNMTHMSYQIEGDTLSAVTKGLSDALSVIADDLESGDETELVLSDRGMLKLVSPDEWMWDSDDDYMLERKQEPDECGWDPTLGPTC